MQELERSKRSVERATYTPIKAARPIELPAGRALEWYEYTPTSAIDIAFNETLPSA